MCPFLVSRVNPYAEYAYDGIGLNPMEVLFVKVKDFQREGEWTTTRMAITYDRWIATQVCRSKFISADYSCANDYQRLLRCIMLLVLLVKSAFGCTD